MAARKPAAAKVKAPEHDDSAAVDALLAALDHPLKPLVQSIRAAILKADAKVTEGVKWNSPSFHRLAWFATVNVRPKGGVLVVLHLGAKPRPGVAVRDEIDDDAGLLHWHSADRASIGFQRAEEFEDARKAFAKIVRSWVKAVERVA